MGRGELNLYVGCYPKASGFYSHFVREPYGINTHLVKMRKLLSFRQDTFCHLDPACQEHHPASVTPTLVARAALARAVPYHDFEGLHPFCEHRPPVLTSEYADVEHTVPGCCLCPLMLSMKQVNQKK